MSQEEIREILRVSQPTCKVISQGRLAVWLMVAAWLLSGTYTAQRYSLWPNGFYFGFSVAVRDDAATMGPTLFPTIPPWVLDMPVSRISTVLMRWGDRALAMAALWWRRLLNGMWALREKAKSRHNQVLGVCARHADTQIENTDAFPFCTRW